MHKVVRTLILDGTIITGFAGSSYAIGFSGASAPVPLGAPR
jgi:hypothetical protein